MSMAYTIDFLNKNADEIATNKALDCLQL